MKRIIWGCDICHKESEGSLLGILPLGWLECSFYNETWNRYCFCGYTCLVQWAEARASHYGKKYAVNEEVPYVKEKDKTVNLVGKKT